MDYESFRSVREKISPEEYLKLKDKDKANIADSRIVPPSLENPKDFGSFEVIYNTSSYKNLGWI